VLVTVFLHEVDVTAHPTVPPGWRWAVHLGGNPHDVSKCMNAGWCPNKTEAALEGEMVGISVAKALKVTHSQEVTYRVQVLDVDPIAEGIMVVV
jgi:hypothetical protein